MNQLIVKRVFLYVVGLFMLSTGVSLSIYANFGVSPASSLAYAVSLASGITIGLTTIMTHIVYILIQIIITKRFDAKNALVQLMIAFLFGFFIDSSLSMITALLPSPTNLFMQLLYLVISLFLVAIGLFGYSNAQFTLMPYDELTRVMSTEFKMPFGKAKIIGDIANVIVSTTICLVFLGELGSIGIGTFVAAVAIGKIVGVIAPKLQGTLDNFLQEVEEEELA